MRSNHLGYYLDYSSEYLLIIACSHPVETIVLEERHSLQNYFSLPHLLNECVSLNFSSFIYILMLFFSAFFTQPQFKSSYDVSFGPPQHVLRDGQFYTSTDQSPLPSPIPSLIELPPEPVIKDLRSRLWSLNRHPYLAFIFNSPEFGLLMGHFSHFNPSVLICSSSTELWHLPKDTAKSWKLFEHLIRSIAEKLQLYFTAENPNIPVIWEVPAKPNLYGYFTPHTTLEAATVAINNSIDGFIIYTAYISFLIALCQCTTSIWEGPSIEKLFVNAGIQSHQEWISGLLESGIGDFKTTRRRMGSIVIVDQ